MKTAVFSVRCYWQYGPHTEDRKLNAEDAFPLAIGDRFSQNIITPLNRPRIPDLRMFPMPLAARKIVCLAALALAVAPTAPVSAATPIDYNRDIRPILSESCFKCHGPGTQKGGLRLDLGDRALQKKVILAGKPDESPLLSRVMAADDERMPPRTASDRLAPEKIAKLRAWIEQGARYAPHWSFIKPEAKTVPPIAGRDWPKNPIDYFILAKLEAAGLKPSPPADKATLIRRLSLDLIGLLPTPKEVEDFVRDDSEGAYEKLADRLLASPHYGERHGRQWLDMARYADSNGFTFDHQRTIWPYRDWVIDAFNRDMPFDQFTIEQLAGDLLPHPTQDQLIATGFQRNTPLNEEGGTDPEQFRAERTVDRTNTIGTVWLGLTVGCTQCHDHKFDPISQKEYYSLYAFFDSTSEPVLKMATPEQEKHLAELNAKLAEAKRIEETDPKKPSAKAQKLRSEIKNYESMIKSSLIVHDYPRTTYVHLRGDFLSKGDVVAPATPAVLPSLKAAANTPNRLDLARWLVSAENPLTPRVAVNRMWQHYFGRGLVETENDFGTQGRLPTHPELLDWLAAEFVRSGWSTKTMHRLIVTSAAYRQASTARSELAEKDPNNLLLGRQNRLRVEAEIVRDAALCASGLLCDKIGGPGVYPPQPKELFSFTQASKGWPESRGEDRYRRGMYTFIWRQSQHPLLTTFDGADAQTACTRRNRSNTPLQALHLANDPVFVELAEGLGKRILKEGPVNDAGRIDFAFELCFSRKPLTSERDRVLRYRNSLEASTPEKAWMMVARVLLNLDEFIVRE
jgi:mono/diheme cytochrome c family protein